MAMIRHESTSDSEHVYITFGRSGGRGDRHPCGCRSQRRRPHECQQSDDSYGWYGPYPGHMPVMPIGNQPYHYNRDCINYYSSGWSEPHPVIWCGKKEEPAKKPDPPKDFCLTVFDSRSNLQAQPGRAVTVAFPGNATIAQIITRLIGKNSKAQIQMFGANKEPWREVTDKTTVDELKSASHFEILDRDNDDQKILVLGRGS